MIRPGTLPLLATRTAPLDWMIRFVGIDLTGATIAGEVLQNWDQPGDPKIALPGGQTGTADGFRAPVPGTTEGVPHSDVRLYIDDGTLEAIPGPDEDGSNMEPGTTLRWVWRMWITPSGGVKSVYLEGAFSIGGPATGVGAGSGEAFDAIVTIVDNQVVVNLGGAALTEAALGEIVAAGEAALDDIDDALGTALAAISAASGLWPNGTEQRFASLVTTAGTTISSTVQAALRAVENELRATGLLSKIVRLNLCVGNGAAAARIPFAMRAVVGNGADTGTLSSFTEASGLSGTTGLDTGVTLENAGLGQYNIGLGCYLLADPGADAGYVIGGGSWGLNPWSGNSSFATASFITFDFYGRVIGDIGKDHEGGGIPTRTYYASGAMVGLRLPSGDGMVLENGVALTGAGSATAPGDALATFPTDSVKIRTNVAAIGGYWITDGMTQAEGAALSWIVHEFNVAIGRGASAEGLS